MTKSIRVLERLTGRGLLVTPQLKIPVSYSLRVTQEMHDTMPGLKDTTGQVEFADPRQDPGPILDRLVLQLDDGRALSVFYQGGGRVQGTGAFSNPNKA